MSGQRLRVAVVFGGRSVEHEVSVRSAGAVLQALDPARFEAFPVAVSRDGGWWVGEAVQDVLSGRTAIPSGSGPWVFPPDPSFRGLAGPDPSGGWRHLPVDVVFPLIHGGHGEDGTLQGLLELAGLPYVGSGVTASALGMDKRLQRRLFRAAGLPVLPTLEIPRAGWEGDRPGQRRRILAEIGTPCFVKPSVGGSSVGVGKVHQEGELDAAMEEAARYDGMLLVEPAVEAREIECAILGNRQPEASAPGEIVPGREFYDYRAKYLEDTSRLLLPAPVSDAVSRRVRHLARSAFECLGCAGLARVDFFLDRRDGETLWLNEINTLPGFTSISMYPRLWDAEGIPLRDLVSRLIDLALEVHRDRARNQETLNLSAD